MIERREVSWWRLFTRHWLWLPVLLMVFGLVVAGLGGNEYRRNRQLDRSGVDGIAVIEDRSIHTRRDSEGRTRTSYRVRFSFAPASGDRISAQRNVAPGFYGSVRVGDQVPVRYLPDRPQVNAIGPMRRREPLIFLLIGLAVVAGASGFALVLGRNKLSLIRAARHGEIREARVTAHEQTNVQVNKRQQYRFSWFDAAGASGRSAMLDFHKLPEVGSVVRVYIDPDSDRGWWEGDI